MAIDNPYMILFVSSIAWLAVTPEFSIQKPVIEGKKFRGKIQVVKEVLPRHEGWQLD